MQAWAPVHDDRHDDAVRTGIRRVAVTKVDDSGTQQLADLDGFEGDSPQGTVRVQSHGFSSNPPEGSEGVAIAFGGRSERTHVLGLEHKDHRPTDLDPGDCKLYNAKSARVHLMGDDIAVDAKGNGTITLKSLTIRCGDVTVVIDGDGLRQTGGMQKHDDHDVGATHKHKDSQPGSGTTGVPQ